MASGNFEFGRHPTSPESLASSNRPWDLMAWLAGEVRGGLVRHSVASKVLSVQKNLLTLTLRDAG